MSDYVINLTPTMRCEGTEGSLDTSIVNGVSLARNVSMLMVVNGTTRKVIKAADGATINNTIAGITDYPGFTIVDA